MIKRIALAAVVSIAASALHAATPGLDDASDPVYGGSGTGSFNGKDGGTPATFGPWTVTANPAGTTSAGSFIGDSTTLAPGNGGGNINTSGVSFGLFGYGDAYVNATRSFDAPLSLGQTFSIQLAVNFRNGNKGIDLRDASGNIVFDLNIGGDIYSVNNTPPGVTTNLFNNAYDPNTVFTVQLTQTDATAGTWTIIRSGGMSGTASSGIFPYQGVPASIDLYNVQTTDNGAPEDNLFFNNLQIIPEPSPLTLFAGSGFLGGLICLRRRRAKVEVR
ncbi:MAG: hypothetical protein H0X40_07510 [Chthoniobacterales bacterium]|nr:hypothetical protein [Chthoniobacterales bacterium]